MIDNLFRMRRVVDGREVREPTLLTLSLTATAFLLLLAVLAGAVFITANFGLGWGLFAAVAGLLGALLLWPRRDSAAPVTGRERWQRWLHNAGRKLFAVALTGWLALIAWSQLGHGGPMPVSKADPNSVRVLTWNLLRGQDQGPVWEQNNWPARKRALDETLRQAQPDILLVQEARSGQLAFLDETLPGHRRVGVGRDDGKSGGEHCAIYFREGRFERLDDDTFWLEEPTDRPRGPGLDVKRICTQVRLKDRVSGRILRVYNTHQYLTAGAQLPASHIILDHIKTGDPSDAVLLAGDFNATPKAPSRRVFAEAGLRESAALACKGDEGTFQFSGIRLRCLDGILVDTNWRVRRYEVVNVKPGGVYPSDHFGVMADLRLER
jgi:endonuclease/exonuclease/phosphatase family metal-dependent hydrolase